MCEYTATATLKYILCGMNKSSVRAMQPVVVGVTRKSRDTDVTLKSDIIIIIIVASTTIIGPLRTDVDRSIYRHTHG